MPIPSRASGAASSTYQHSDFPPAMPHSLACASLGWTCTERFSLVKMYFTKRGRLIPGSGENQTSPTRRPSLAATWDGLSVLPQGFSTTWGTRRCVGIYPSVHFFPAASYLSSIRHLSPYRLG